MVKDYIERLILEEEEEIEKLQTQMKKSLAELQSSQEWLENLQREKNIDYNIFSPRKFDAEADEKIEKAKSAVREHDQNVEYIRKQIESHVKRNQEYLKMQEEDAGLSSEIDTDIETDEKMTGAITETIEEAGSEKKISDDSSESVTDAVKDAVDEKTATIKETELLAFLKSIYKKTEVSLALLNGDKNKCKNEMKSIMHEIKKYVSELEKNEKK